MMEKYIWWTMLTAFTLGAQKSSAQSSGSPVVHKNIIFSGITLTAVQQARIDTIHARATLKLKQRLDAQPKGSKVTPDFTGLRDSTWAEMRSVLTSDQQASFDANLAAFRQRSAQANTKLPKPKVVGPQPPTIPPQDAPPPGAPVSTKP